ncbi:MAG: MarR family transcriptional regulator [Alphaproteobacteria bacterium]|nr:MarR family transcriptional regulator [Alphaproteobacteria bacterium]
MSEASKCRLRMWLRLLAVTRKSENRLREFLRVNHRTTLPRFDAMVALHRCPEGMTMGELSRKLLVSNGNSTAVIDRLEKEGLVRRKPSEADRRTVYVTLSEEGLRQFERFAESHEREIETMFSGLTESDIDTLTAILKRMGKGETE